MEFSLKTRINTIYCDGVLFAQCSFSPSYPNIHVILAFQNTEFDFKKNVT
jgi:hypothetical protein